MDLGLISVRYARALLKASNQEQQSEQVYADMQTLAAEYVNVPELSVTIANPMLSREQKEALLIPFSCSRSTWDTSLGLILSDILILLII